MKLLKESWDVTQTHILDDLGERSGNNARVGVPAEAEI